jgi:hypothetical protein
MGQLFQLVLHGGDNLRMQMAGIEHRDTAGKIEIFPAFDVPHPAVLRAFGEDRVDLADAARTASLRRAIIALLLFIRRSC